MALYLSGLNKLLLSMFSGSVINGKNAAPPSADETTNLTADQTAMFGNGVICGSRPFAKRTLKPAWHMSKAPAF